MSLITPISGNRADSENKSYILGTGETAAMRLRLLHEVYGKSTESLLTTLGLQQGMRIADIGCGIGVVSRWMAENVGTQGSVVGVDISTAQLAIAQQDASLLGLTQLSFQQADVYDTGLPRGSFDMVYCRFLLCHLTQPEKALQEMYALLKPGGILLCDDLHLSSLHTDPPSAAYERMTKLMVGGGSHKGVDYNLGVKLHRLFRQVGFKNLQMQSDQPGYTVGECKRFWEYTFYEASADAIQAGIFTVEDVEKLKAELEAVAKDETIMVTQARKVQVWAKKI